MRRLAPLGPVLALACGSSADPSPAPAPAVVPPPPVPATSQPAPPAVAPPPVPAAIPEPPSPFRFAARGDRWLTIRPLGDAVAVFDLEQLAVAAPPTAALVAQRVRVPWSGVFQQPPGALGAAFEVDAELGGRWPDAVTITVNSADDRAYPEATVLRLAGKAWKPVPLPARGGLRPFYAGYATWRDGAALALRLWSTTEASSELETEPGDAVDRFRAALVRVDGGADQPPALPRDASAKIVRFAASPTGAISVLTDAGELHRWTPDANRWQVHPAPKLEAQTTVQLLEGTDGSAWLSACFADGSILWRLHAGAWTQLAPPRPGCPASLAHAGATLWTVFQGIKLPDGSSLPSELWRADTSDALAWQKVALPPLIAPHRGPRVLNNDQGTWSIDHVKTDIPPDGVWPLYPDEVVAVGGAVWLSAWWDGGGVALVDHPVTAVLEPASPPPKPSAKPCEPLFLTLAELPADAAPPPEVTAAIEREAVPDVALVVTAAPSRTLGLAWLPSFTDPAEDIDSDPTFDDERWRAAKSQLQRLGAAVTAAWPTAKAPRVQCWIPKIERLVWAPPD